MGQEGVTDGSETVGETEFAQGIAAMAASGKWGKTRVAEGIISGEAGLAKGGLLTLGAEKLEKVLHYHIGSRNFRGIRTFAVSY
jgi:L-fuconolactonase